MSVGSLFPHNDIITIGSRGWLRVLAVGTDERVRTECLDLLVTNLLVG